MGVLCNKLYNAASEAEFVIDELKEFKAKKYRSSYDSYYTSFEKRFNLLKYITLSEFSMMFSNFNFQNRNENNRETNQITQLNKVSAKSDIFSEDVDGYEFSNFFKSKVINHHLVYGFKTDNHNDQIFLDYVKKLYEIISKGLVSFVRLVKKRSNSISNQATNLEKKQKKFFLAAFGLLFCQSDDWTKINYLFDVFVNENNKLEPTNNFRTFLFVLFLTASFGGITCIQEMSKIYADQINKVTEEDYMKTLEIYEVSDIMRISEKFCADFFGVDGVVSYYEYRDKMLNDGFDWILTGSGIRLTLENKDG